MAFSTTGNGGRSGRIARTTMAEINVTPLVDVMLVLLVIFMTASSLETARLSREAETLRQVAAEEVSRDDGAGEEQQVPVNLPKAQADRIVPGKGKERRPVLTFDGLTRIYLDRDQLVDCRAVTGAFEGCLDAFEAALQHHPRAEQAREVHLRADETLKYGQVLALMARMRRAGIRRFGLVTRAASPSAPGAAEPGATGPVPAAPAAPASAGGGG